MNEIKINSNDVLIMNLVHYFIKEKNYNPVILHGINDEIWLENLDNDYKIIRIVSHYIHNDEQLNFDRFKLKKILDNLKKKTFTFDMPILSIYTSLGENVNLPEKKDNIYSIVVSNNSEIKNKGLIEVFPDIVEKTTHKEEGLDLIVKISDDINKESFEKSKKIEKIFSIKKPVITYLLIGICILMFIITYLFQREDIFILGGNIKDLTRNGEYYRLLTCIFLHGGIIHITCNMYSLYIIGTQLESFFGKIRYLIIFLLSGICGSVLSLAFSNSNSISIGASGAIFGLLGAILYFGYHYRVYLGNVLKNQIIPIILLNLGIGFIVSGIDNFAHIGGLIGGIFTTMACGIPGKEIKKDRINGLILLTIYLSFIIYLAFVK
ncbi:MAG: rhomboid family intramembrane serine protease [Bacilli bacterium]|nr:rhomboid family intramembrane serine protease [Bacilli bacterium]